MALEGGCYCGQVRYTVDSEPLLKAQCHCRECQYITGGGPNFFMMVPGEGFRILKGKPKGFSRSDLPQPVSREFCPNCGTHLITRLQGRSDVIVKVGTLDKPQHYGAPQIAIHVLDEQPYHKPAETMPRFDRLPPR